MGVYIHYGLATHLYIDKAAVERCKIDYSQMHSELKRFFDIDAYTHEESDSDHIFTAKPELFLCELGPLIEAFQILYGTKDVGLWKGLRQLDWSSQTIESIEALAQNGSDYYFQAYDEPEPEYSNSFRYGNQFMINHSGIMFEQEGKIVTEGIYGTLDLISRLLRKELSKYPSSRFLKVWLNL
jgi:hypothetical protein